MALPRNHTRGLDRNKQYQLLAIGRNQLGWDDEFYYGIWLPMQGATLKDRRYSASTLSDAQLLAAVGVMKDAGFKVVPANKAAKPDRTVLADDAQSKKIRALWLAMHGQGIVRDPAESALAHYVWRITGIEALQWLDSNQARRVIESLKKWQARCVHV